MNNSYPLAIKKPKSQGKKTFIIALIIAFAIFLPFIIKDKGLFLMYGDYNVQQVPFYQLAHNAVRNGNVFWNWNTDLGVNFIGSYSFYLLYSPFFWLTLPFPNSWLPYLMGPLLILKTACAAYTAYLYLERFVKDKTYALVGSLLYAFSGWMFFNLFFNHFHDIAVFFPLLLLGVEKLVTEDKKLFFAFTVTANLLVNYWFFVGEVVFVIIYIIVRSYNKDWGITLKRFGRIVVESIFGLMLSAFATLPSVLALLGNPRTGSDRLMSGWAFWSYYTNTNNDGYYPQRLLAILQSFFFPPDLTARPNFLPDHGAEWASLSAWLPLFGLVGVIAYFIQNKNKPTWLKKTLPLLLVFALIPGLNSLFVALNRGYYARWFYMLILLMCLATIIALDNSYNQVFSFYQGIKWVGIISIVFAVASGLTPHEENGVWKLGLARDIELVWVWFGIVVGGLILVVFLMKIRRRSTFKRWLIGSLSFVIIVFGVTYLYSGKAIYPRSDEIIEVALNNQGKFQLPDEGFVRSDIYDDTDNLLMYWNIPSIQAFHSIVPPSIMEFYDFIGIKRNEASRPQTDDFALRSLLSVKWLFIKEDKEEQSPMQNYLLFDNQNGYNIYENQSFIPMGFTYEYYVYEDQLENVLKEDRSQLMLRAVVLESNYFGSLFAQNLKPLPNEELENINTANYLKDSANRGENIVSNFQITQKGFTANTNFTSQQIVFFSVPYDTGWSASINGVAKHITKANIGFMAILVPAGENTIIFDYNPPGLKIGGIISLATLTLIIFYWLMIRRKTKLKTEELENQKDWLGTAKTTLSWDEYLARYGDEERSQRMTDEMIERKKEYILKQMENRS